MIVTCTPNPSLDRTVEVAALRRGQVHRASATHLDAGGKGVNVTRVLARHGAATLAVLPLGGAEGRHFADLLGALGLAHRRVEVAGATRTNITVVEDDGTTTKLNAPGPSMSAAELAELLDAAVAAAAEADDPDTWVAGCGSLPPGAPEDFYARLVEQVHGRTSARVAIDSSGPALRAALDAGPDLVKPNDEELAAVTGHDIATLGDAVDAADTLVGKGVATVLVSLGRHGALVVRGAEARHAEPPTITVRSTVGAGDAALAGWLHSSSRPAADGASALAGAVAWGSAAAALPGTTMPGPDDLDLAAVTVHPTIDRDRRLDG